MKIPNTLEQFTRPSLLIVTGSQTAKIYLAHDGEITELDAVSVPTPEYSDREGHFMKTGHGEVQGSGSVYEAKEKPIRDEFLGKLSGTLNSLQHNVDIESIYLFAPEHHLNETKEKLPYQLLEKGVVTIPGNYVKDHPTELVTRL